MTIWNKGILCALALTAVASTALGQSSPTEGPTSSTHFGTSTGTSFGTSLDTSDGSGGFNTGFSGLNSGFNSSASGLLGADDFVSGSSSGATNSSIPPYLAPYGDRGPASDTSSPGSGTSGLRNDSPMGAVDGVERGGPGSGPNGGAY